MDISRRKKPKQQRALQLVAAIEQACLQILEKEGPAHLTTNRIAEVAGVGISSLYQYFPNKEAVLAAVYEARVAAEAEAIVLGRERFEELANRSLEEALRAVIRTEIETRGRLSRLNQRFYGRYHRTFDLIAAVNMRTTALVKSTSERWLTTVLERHCARLRVTNLPLASFLVSTCINENIGIAVERRPDLLDSRDFEEELLTLALRYLETGLA